MTSTLLLPLDGSEKDQWALPVGAAFAELTQADILLAHVIDAAPEGDSRRYAERLLGKTAKHVAAPSGHVVSYEVVEGADVANALLQVADERAANLIVMATRAPTGLDRAVHGSVAARLARESLRPIVVAPPGARYLQGKHLRLRRVLVPVDGSRASLSVLSHLSSWPLIHDVEIVLLQAVEPEPTGGYMMPVPLPSDAEQPRGSNDDAVAAWAHVHAERAEEQLNALAERLRTFAAAVEFRVVEHDDVAAVIHNEIRQALVDFIAMTTHGAGGVKRFLLGSVAERVVHRSEIPVLLVTPDDR